MMEPLNLFYAEPDEDRWFPGDRHPRRLIRRLVRGPRRPGGQMRVFLNLCAGLEKIGHPFRANHFRHARRHPDELCCILGKRGVLDRWRGSNPLMVGPCVHNHPVDDPELLRRRDVRRVLVPGEWMRRMCEPYWGPLVQAWPVGIDTGRWAPAPGTTESAIVVIYDKILWQRERRRPRLLEPISRALADRGFTPVVIRYGDYRPEEYRLLLQRARCVVYLCEHETQGIACHEALACDVPVLAWERNGPWEDPEYYPQRVNFAPATAVPYWDERCGERFADAADFSAALERLEAARAAGQLAPRAFVLEHLSLEHCARLFVAHAQAAAQGTGAGP